MCVCVCVCVFWGWVPFDSEEKSDLNAIAFLSWLIKKCFKEWQTKWTFYPHPPTLPHGDTVLHSSHPPRSTLWCSNLGVIEGIREMLSLAPEHSFCQFQWRKCCHFPERLIGILRLQTPLKTNFQLFPTVRKLPSVCLDLCHYFQLQPLSVQIYWLHDQHHQS